MGSAHMEQELQSTVIKIAKKHSDILAEKTGVDSSMIESDVKEDMAMVLSEIHKS
jgi:flagellar biosynthesis/type III secretory pathway protein FliH